jgi:hypothetical protein
VTPATHDAIDLDRLDQIRAVAKNHNGILIRNRPESAIAHRRELLALIDELLAQNKQLTAAVERTTTQMRKYGSGSVNVRQVINLLSPTWPDGNYEQPADRHRPLTDETCGVIPTKAGLDYLALRRQQHPKAAEQ